MTEMAPWLLGAALAMGAAQAEEWRVVEDEAGIQV